MGLGLGEGGVVAAGAADQRPTGAAASGRQQVAVAFAVEEGRTGQAAGETVGGFASIYVVRPRPRLDKVVLGAGVDRVVAEPAGEADAADRQQRADHPQAVAAGAEVSHQPARRPVGGAGDSGGITRRVLAARADREAGFGGDAEGLADFVEGDEELVAAATADHLQPGAAAGGRGERDVGARFRRRFLAAGGGASFRADAAVAALAAVERVGTAAADEVVVTRAAVHNVPLRAADQGVAESRAFE